jgi:cyclophilin family peptidyl-prolyl cis-trans isomerase
MKGLLFLLLGLMVMVGMVKADGGESTRVVLETSKGNIVVALDADKAPISVENFLGYVESGFYDGTVFHRVIDGFMIQGGGFTQEMVQKETRGTIENEADNGLKHKRGTVAMARRPDPDSATAQFFVNLADNAFLDHTAKTDRGWGYAVFGEVVEGMDVVDAIAKVETGRHGPMGDVPTEPVIIQKAYLEEAASPAE